MADPTAGDGDRAAAHSGPRQPGEVVPGRFIVALDRGITDVSARAHEVATAAGVTPELIYETVLVGFSATITDEALPEIEAHPQVRQVSPVRVIQGLAGAGSGEESDIPHTAGPPPASGVDPPTHWGHYRINQRALPLQVVWDPIESGSDTHIYIVDTGIYSGHEQFGSSAGSWVADAPERYDVYRNSADSLYGEECWDENFDDWMTDHGTAMVSVAAGATSGAADNIGVAQSATIYTVRVLNCGGNVADPPEGVTDSVVGAIDWVAENHNEPAVANLSWRVAHHEPIPDPDLDEAIQDLVDAGVTVVVSAGNDNDDACNYMPAHMDSVLTVGASTVDDQRWSGSNHGGCIDLLAPGHEIYSARAGNGTGTGSGTSEAAA